MPIFKIYSNFIHWIVTNIPSLINRVINEHSHLTYIDRGWKPIDIHEAEECVKTIIDKIREKDSEQFEALVQSVRK